MGTLGNQPNFGAYGFTRTQAESFNGTGSATSFTLGHHVKNAIDIEVLVDNVQQSPFDGSYSVSGTTLTFSGAPASGTNNVYVMYRQVGTVIDTQALVPDDNSVTYAKLGNDIPLGNRNLIINGAMQVAQRGTSVSTSSTGYNTIDRFYIEGNGSTPTVTMSQDTASTPDTFAKSLKLQVTSTGTPAGFNIAQKIEGFNFYSAGFGKSTAKNITLSFWVRSSITGTYSTAAMNSTANRSYVSEYTINAADTWEKKTITIDGDTTGTWPSTSGMSLQLFFCLDNDGGGYSTSTIGSWVASNKYAGSTNQVNWAGTNGATFYLTGVQLEVGTKVTPFEHRSYAEELAACQRYFWRLDRVSGGGNTIAIGSNYSNSLFYINYPIAMRTAPSVSKVGTDLSIYSNVTRYQNPTFNGVGGGVGRNGTRMLFALSGARGNAIHMDLDNDNTYFNFDAEL